MRNAQRLSGNGTGTHVTATLAAALLATLVLPGCRHKAPEPERPHALPTMVDAIAAAPDVVGQPIGDGEREVFLPHVREEMLSAGFWVGRMEDPEAVRMTPEEVAAYSRLGLESSHGALQDLASFPDSLSRAELSERALSWSLGDRPLFREGVEVPRHEVDAVALNRNEVGMLDSNPVRLGTTWQRCNLRMWPTDKPTYETADDHRFDLFQATALEPAEPLVILHESLDGNWWFVRAYNCDGWLPKRQVALMLDRAEWLSLVAPERFLVVTGAHLVLGPDCGSETLAGTVFSMGARLPLSAKDSPTAGDGNAGVGHRTGEDRHTVRLPERATNGTGRLVSVVIPQDPGVQAGYLPFSRANVVRQAFRMLGQPYGWGGLDGGVDCSAFIAGVYRTMGLLLPRNSGRQELVPGRSFPLARLEQDDESDAEPSGLRDVPAGSSLFLKGHTLIYLGNVDGRDYAIHAMSAYLSDGRKVPVFGVVVSDLSLVRTSGVTLADSLTSAVDFMQRGGGI